MVERPMQRDNRIYYPRLTAREALRSSTSGYADLR